MITDILNSNSEILALGSNTDKVEAAFNFVLDIASIDLINNSIYFTEFVPAE